MFFIMAICDSEDSSQFFSELYMRYKRLLFREGLKYIDDPGVVEDLVHDAFIRLIQKEELLRSFNSCTLRTYIVYSIRNASISHLRKKTAEKKRVLSNDDCFDASFAPDTAPLPEEVIIMDEKKQEFLKVWDTLPEDTRELLAGKYILRMSDAELAEEFGCSPDSIRMKLTRARRRALEMMKEGGLSYDPA